MGSEDQTACFYLYLVPAPWRHFFALSQPVPASKFGTAPTLGALELGSDPSRLLYLHLWVVPMGWNLAVDLIQGVNETIIGQAGLHEPFVILVGLVLRDCSRAATRAAPPFILLLVGSWSRLYTLVLLAVRQAYSSVGVVRDETVHG
eukprot:3512406-Amphidinium_carterae.3